MTELVLHFDPDSGIDAAAAAEALTRQLADMEAVDAASSEVDQSRTSLPDVLIIVTMATTLLSNSATALDALRKAIHAAKGVAEELGLRNPRVEVGMTQVPTDELSDAHLEDALQSPGS